MFKLYPAVIEQGNSGFGVFFPDLPGCTSGGDTVDEAINNAHEALSLHLAGMIEDGDPLPAATPLDQVTTDDDVQVAHITLIRVPVTGKTQRINITMDSTLLAAIDDVTTNRSAWLADAALAALRGQHR